MSIQTKSLTLAINTVDDIVILRSKAREMAAEIGFGLSDRTRAATAVSELARNALQYANGGEATIANRSSLDLKVMYVCIQDYGPGIADLDQALCDGYTTSGGLGVGLPGCRRLMDRFVISSVLSQGTKVEVELHATQ